MAGAPSISFCMTTRGPAARAHALLSLVRPYVDEIVLAVDDRSGAETLDACADLADRRLTFEFVAPPCRLIGWMQHQCTCDWLLRFDDDEIPSRALLDALGELTSDRGPTHYGLTRRWLHPDRRAYLLSPPWQPDHQLRLVRNVTGLWRFTGRMHDPAIVLGERRLVDLPIYHADLLLLSADERRAKAERYERLRPGHRAEGVSVNAIYVPEDRAGLVSAPVPPEDAELLERVLDAPAPPPATGRGAPVVHATAADVDRFNTTRTVPQSAYGARLRFVRPVTSLRAGAMREQEVLVRNLGDERWPPGDDGEPLIRLGHRWLRDGEDEPLGEGPRSAFTETVVPGGSTLAKLLVHVPAEPGAYVLEVDVVHEHVRWFGCPARLRIEVVGEAGAGEAGTGEAGTGEGDGGAARSAARGLVPPGWRAR